MLVCGLYIGGLGVVVVCGFVCCVVLVVICVCVGLFGASWGCLRVFGFFGGVGVWVALDWHRLFWSG